MTNEEKAAEIANNDGLYNIENGCIEDCRIAALEMAKWKDQQILEYINLNVALQKKLIVEIKRDVMDLACRIVREKGYFKTGRDRIGFRNEMKKRLKL